ncbi:hypothetical protein KAFR_0C03680 [Kazachstania africana CBS 2517]|uniref:Rho-GAP domain-containing protein n=1 Tax=Kazachstania africana (strain ATCC 22294 / BCRC 22015 / CBS 2517 / CECT 1963 / NBRC 1671 / NRRL Y-8276) TaxID=1071382 RepID=H2ASL0_KAZAF|nr:hypothetical protein KAFR_0C03680 [Kazachstania africana CBS 2517]CCF57360.1 hypothetical protein KAFR_0C03680 [Kazachstania africana CBS 2517]
MPSFADSFWSDDPSVGLKTVFNELYNGSDQCNQFIQLFASRMQFEVAYGKQLLNLNSGIDKVSDIHSKNTVRIALEGIVEQTESEGREHINIASNIETLVLRPFSQWCEDHKERIKYSEKTLFQNVDNFKKSKSYVAKLEKDYFNKCKKLEDFKRSTFNDEMQLDNAMKTLDLQKTIELNKLKEKENQNFGKLGPIDFDYKTLRETLKLFLTKLPKTEYKLPFINYSLLNTNSGHEITKFILEIMSFKDYDKAENFGQDLLNYGFLKYCNGVGNTFVNSKKFQYQWKDYAYKFAQIPTNVEENNENKLETLRQKFLFNSTSDVNIEKIETKSTDDAKFTDSEKELFKLMNDVESSDSRYFKECNKMDSLRCSVEELMIDHLAFMEKCELDRVKAIKRATIDFCSAISNKISVLKLFVDNIIDFENKIDPIADILNIISNYSTGLFQPKAITYNNYYNPGIYQNFGIDLETRCRLDKKKVPLLVTVILSYMDSIYPGMENDKIRCSIWTDPVKLSLTHDLRNKLNKIQFQSDQEILSLFEEGGCTPSTIASILKIYLLELPESVIPTEMVEILSVVYKEYPPLNDIEDEDNKEKRVTGVFTTLSSMSMAHIATLNAVMTHFYRLIKILKMGKITEKNQDDIDTANNEGSPSERKTNADIVSNELATMFTENISKEFANCIIHAKDFNGNQLGYEIFKDLLLNKKRIFKELKGQNATNK